MKQIIFLCLLVAVVAYSWRLNSIKKIISLCLLVAVVGYGMIKYNDYVAYTEQVEIERSLYAREERRESEARKRKAEERKREYAERKARRDAEFMERHERFDSESVNVMMKKLEDQSKIDVDRLMKDMDRITHPKVTLIPKPR